MSATRVGLGAIGVAGLLWGVWSLLDDGTEALVSVAIWLAGGIVIHDVVLAPITLGVCFLGARFLPPAARRPAAAAFIVWATVTVTVFAVLSGQGGKAGNDTILDKPYGVAWIVFTALLLVAATAATAVGSRRRPQVVHD